MKRLEQARTANGQIFPSPRENEKLYETPPAFSWLKVKGVTSYKVTVQDMDGNIVWQGRTERNYLVPQAPLPPGNYQWDLSGDGLNRGWQSFSIDPKAVRIPRISAADALRQVPDVRPRHLFFREDIADIVASHPAAVETLRRNIDLALADGLPDPPRYHRDSGALPYREYFGRHRDFCDRNLVACALGHALLQDDRAAAHARKLFLTLCDWNSEGPCSLEGPWGDEVGLSHARCFPAVLDLCYDLLDEKERQFAGRVTAAYAAQCERRLNQLDFCQNPGCSHSGRLPAYLGEAALALKGMGIVPEETLERWLALALDVYGSFFPYFGGPDGGWAEGMFYASSYSKWFLPFFSAIRRFAGVDFLKRPFYQRFCRYLQHFCPPGWEIHPFGDGYWCGAEDPEWPGFFAQNPYHLYAERFGPPLLREWSKNAQQQDIFKLHLLDVFLPEGAPEESSLAGPVSRACAFPDAGFLSLHTHPRRPDRELALVARASRYGSISHQHADQGSFALLYGGTALISPSGYFGRQYGTRHHMEWTNQTCAHNTLLVDGKGQESFSYRATGRILFARDEGERLVGAVDPAGAYEHIVSWTRTFELTDNQLLVRDQVELDQPGQLTWMLHTLSLPEATTQGMRLERNSTVLEIQPLEGELRHPVLTDHFSVDLNAGEPEAYHVSMPPQYHLSWKTPVRKSHEICVRFLVYPGTRNE